MRRKHDLIKIIAILIIAVSLTLGLLIVKNVISPLFWFLIIFAISGLSMLYSIKNQKKFKQEFNDNKALREKRKQDDKNRYI